MKIIRKFQNTNKIVKYLKQQGNPDDNIKSIKVYKNHYEVLLPETHFNNLCFIETSKHKPITLNGRQLINVAQQSIKFTEENKGDLGSNWNLHKIQERSKILKEKPDISPLILRDCGKGSEQGCSFYIQDGNHRCLGYMMMILKEKMQYTPQKAFLATNLLFEANAS